ncbi:hypothetical protein PR001_g17261 [Phytophthora rubi]|uniref:Uncharacterized protein n=2 Tax=Phytophthora rubi TaxID=129364 RepID=A0A6A3KLF2_9STRA|nr:hypothetical protein PR001_g17261 [Phytophthora rubi]
MLFPELQITQTKSPTSRARGKLLPDLTALLHVTSLQAAAKTTCDVAMIYHSMYGHVVKLASSLQAGMTSVSGMKASDFKVQETLNSDLLKALHAPPRPNLPIATPDVLKDAGGMLLGISTRFGTLPAQVKGRFDACGDL